MNTATRPADLGKKNPSKLGGIDTDCPTCGEQCLDLQLKSEKDVAAQMAHIQQLVGAEGMGGLDAGRVGLSAMMRARCMSWPVRAYDSEGCCGLGRVSCVSCLGCLSWLISAS